MAGMYDAFKAEKKNQQNELFDTAPFESETKPAKKHAGKNEPSCGKCKHMIRAHYWRQDWMYCSITPSKRTDNGIMKVRSRQPACEKFSNDQHHTEER